MSAQSPVWTAGWETTGSRQIREVEIALQTWHEWQPPVAEIDDVAEAKTWLGARATRISDFLGTHRTAAGDLSRSVISAWDDHVTWREKSKTLTELTRYREITTEPPESVNWDELKATVAWRDETRKRRGSRRLDLDHPAWKQTGESAFAIAAGMRKRLEDLERFFRGSADEGKVFAALAERLRAIARGLPLIDLWCRKTEWNAKVVAWPELRPFWSRVTDGQTPAGQARPLFCYNFLRLTTPPLEPHGPELAEKLRSFAAQDDGKSDPSSDFNAAVLGPLVRKGGHRRLNVALSRSRSGMTILTSMTAAMLAGSSAKSEGFEQFNHPDRPSPFAGLVEAPRLARNRRRQACSMAE